MSWWGNIRRSFGREDSVTRGPGDELKKQAGIQAAALAKQVATQKAEIDAANKLIEDRRKEEGFQRIRGRRGRRALFSSRHSGRGFRQGGLKKTLG